MQQYTHAFERSKTSSKTPAHVIELLLLDLHLGKTVLPDSDEWSDAVLAVVEEDDPEDPSASANNIWLSGQLTFHPGP